MAKFSSVQSLDRLGHRGGHEGRFNKDPLPVISAGGPCEQFWHEQICPLCSFVHPAFPLPTTASSTLQGALKDCFGEAVVTFEPCKFPSTTRVRRGSCEPSRRSILFHTHAAKTRLQQWPTAPHSRLLFSSCKHFPLQKWDTIFSSAKSI